MYYMKDFRDLQVWQRAHQLTLDIYQAVASFPREEVYGLTSQIKRASSSIAANIAEGCGRKGDAELARFLHYAMGSASELEYHLLLAHELKFLKGDAYRRLAIGVVEVKKMLSKFIARL